MMKTDPGIEKVRSARSKISQEAGHDPEKLIQHYIQYQKRFADRLRKGPEQHDDEPEPAAAEQFPALHRTGRDRRRSGSACVKRTRETVDEGRPVMASRCADGPPTVR